MNQIFTKSLMGALVTDQIINGYLWRGKLDAGTNIATMIMGFMNIHLLASEPNVTKMEHYWDEGFGYIYGESDQYWRKFQEVFWLLNIWLKMTYLEMIKLYMMPLSLEELPL